MRDDLRIVLLHLAVIYFLCKNDKFPMLISFGTFSMLNYIYWGVILRRNKNCCNLSGVSQKLHVRWLAYEPLRWSQHNGHLHKYTTRLRPGQNLSQSLLTLMTYMAWSTVALDWLVDTTPTNKLLWCTPVTFSCVWHVH